MNISHKVLTDVSIFILILAIHGHTIKNESMLNFLLNFMDNTVIICSSYKLLELLLMLKGDKRLDIFNSIAVMQDTFPIFLL